MHLRVVVAGQSQTVDQLARGAFAAEGPVDDAHGDLLAVADLGVRAFREVDVHRHAARVGPHEDLVCTDLRDADVGPAAAFDDARDLAFALAAAAAVEDDRLHAVAVERVAGVAGVDVEVLLHALDAYVDGTALGHARRAFDMGQVVAGQAVFLAGALLDHALVEQAVEDFERLAPSLLRGAARCGGELLERELIVGRFA